MESNISFFPLSLYLARWFWPDLMNRRPFDERPSQVNKQYKLAIAIDLSHIVDRLISSVTVLKYFNELTISTFCWWIQIYLGVLPSLRLLRTSSLVFLPQWGAADAEIKVPSVESIDLKGSPFKAPPEGRPGMSVVSPLSGISGLSFDSTLLSHLLFLLSPGTLYVLSFVPAGPFSWTFSRKFFSIFR